MAVAVQERMVLKLGGNCRSDYRAEVVEGIRHGGAAAQVANVGQLASAGEECTVGAAGVLRISRDLAEFVDSISNAGGSTKRPEIGHRAIFIKKYFAEITVVGGGSAGDLCGRVDGARHADAIAVEHAEVSDGIRSL